MATFITKTFLACSIAFLLYAIWNRPHGDVWAQLRRSANVEDRRDDLSALSAGLPEYRVDDTFAAINKARAKKF